MIADYSLVLVCQARIQIDATDVNASLKISQAQKLNIKLAIRPAFFLSSLVRLSILEYAAPLGGL